MNLTARELAFNILYDIFINDAFSNIAIEKHINSDIDSKEENLVREIVYGVMENELYINHIISRASKVRLKKIHKKILIILKIGVYQLMFMDRIPHSAAVNESVNLAKKHGHRGTIGFVNGILRNISRNLDEYRKINIKDKAEYISIKYSHPKWMVERWIKNYGEDFTESLCKKNNDNPQLNIRVNTLKITKKDLMQKLIDKGLIIKEAKYADDSLIVENPYRITDTHEYKSGLFTIQDESSTLVGQIMDPKPASTVIDLCSAPGGKSTHLAQIMNNNGRIISMDIYDHKIRLVKDNARRLGIDIIDAKLGNALQLDETLIGKGDYILLDAPCSGLGLLRRKPEIKRNRKEEDIQELVDIQYRMLNNAKEYLKDGGILIYSTCTIEKDENNNLVNRFLMENQNFKLVSIEEKVSNKDNMETLDQGYVQLFPHIHGTDGFYIAKMIKER